MGECSSNGTKTLFIGNLNNNISDVDLKKTFELFGEIFVNIFMTIIIIICKKKLFQLLIF